MDKDLLKLNDGGGTGTPGTPTPSNNTPATTPTNEGNVGTVNPQQFTINNFLQTTSTYRPTTVPSYDYYTRNSPLPDLNFDNKGNVLAMGAMDVTKANVTPMSASENISAFVDVNKEEYQTFADYGVKLFKEHDYRRERAANQGNLESLWIGIKNVIPNVVGGLVENVGYLGTLMYDPDKDYENAFTRAGQAMKNPFGEIYLLDPNNAADISDGAWWIKNGFGGLESVASFFATGAGVGGALSTGAKLAARAAKASAMASKALQASAQLATAGTLAYTEGAMSGAQVYKDVYDRHRANGKMHEYANERAAAGAAATVQLNTTINTMLNLTGVGAFMRRTDDVVQAAGRGVRNELRQKAGETAFEAAERISKLEYQPSMWNSFKSIGLEMGQEALEEATNVFAEKAGTRIGMMDKDVYDKEGYTSGLTGYLKQFNQLGNYIDDVAGAEGASAMFWGALMGGGQKLATDNIPLYKYDKVDDQGNYILNEKGERVKERMSSRAQQNRMNEVVVNRAKMTLAEDLRSIQSVVDEMTELQRNEKGHPESYIKDRMEALQTKLFNMEAYRSVRDGKADYLINTFKSIAETDNTRPYAEKLQQLNNKIDTDISKLEGKLAKLKPESPEAKKISQQIEALNKRKANNENIISMAGTMTEAAFKGFTDKSHDDSFKDKAKQAVSDLEAAKKEYDDVMYRYNYGDEETKSYAEHIYHSKVNIRDLRKKLDRAKKDIETTVNERRKQFDDTSADGSANFNEAINHYNNIKGLELAIEKEIEEHESSMRSIMSRGKVSAIEKFKLKYPEKFAQLFAVHGDDTESLVKGLIEHDIEKRKERIEKYKERIKDETKKQQEELKRILEFKEGSEDLVFDEETLKSIEEQFKKKIEDAHTSLNEQEAQQKAELFKVEEHLNNQEKDLAEIMSSKGRDQFIKNFKDFIKKYRKAIEDEMNKEEDSAKEEAKKEEAKKEKKEEKKREKEEAKKEATDLESKVEEVTSTFKEKLEAVIGEESDIIKKFYSDLKSKKLTNEEFLKELLGLKSKIKNKEVREELNKVIKAMAPIVDKIPGVKFNFIGKPSDKGSLYKDVELEIFYDPNDNTINIAVDLLSDDAFNLAYMLETVSHEAIHALIESVETTDPESKSKMIHDVGEMIKEMGGSDDVVDAVSKMEERLKAELESLDSTEDDIDSTEDDIDSTDDIETESDDTKSESTDKLSFDFVPLSITSEEEGKKVMNDIANVIGQLTPGTVISNSLGDIKIVLESQTKNGQTYAVVAEIEYRDGKFFIIGESKIIYLTSKDRHLSEYNPVFAFTDSTTGERKIVVDEITEQTFDLDTEFYIVDENDEVTLSPFSQRRKDSKEIKSKPATVSTIMGEVNPLNPTGKYTSYQEALSNKIDDDRSLHEIMNNPREGNVVYTALSSDSIMSNMLSKDPTSDMNNILIYKDGEWLYFINDDRENMKRAFAMPEVFLKRLYSLSLKSNASNSNHLLPPVFSVKGAGFELKTYGMLDPDKDFTPVKSKPKGMKKPLGAKRKSKKELKSDQIREAIRALEYIRKTIERVGSVEAGIEEFITQGLTNKEFSSFLASTPSPKLTEDGRKESLWDYFKRIILTLIDTITDGKSRLDELSQIMDRYIKSDVHVENINDKLKGIENTVLTAFINPQILYKDNSGNIYSISKIDNGEITFEGGSKMTTSEFIVKMREGEIIEAVSEMDKAVNTIKESINNVETLEDALNVKSVILNMKLPASVKNKLIDRLGIKVKAVVKSTQEQILEDAINDINKDESIESITKKVKHIGSTLHASFYDQLHEASLKRIEALSKREGYDSKELMGMLSLNNKDYNEIVKNRLQELMDNFYNELVNVNTIEDAESIRDKYYQLFNNLEDVLKRAVSSQPELKELIEKLKAEFPRLEIIYLRAQNRINPTENYVQILANYNTNNFTKKLGLYKIVDTDEENNIVTIQSIDNPKTEYKLSAYQIYDPSKTNIDRPWTTENLFSVKYTGRLIQVSSAVSPVINSNLFEFMIMNYANSIGGNVQLTEYHFRQLVNQFKTKTARDLMINKLNEVKTLMEDPSLEDAPEIRQQAFQAIMEDLYDKLNKAETVRISVDEQRAVITDTINNSTENKSKAIQKVARMRLTTKTSIANNRERSKLLKTRSAEEKLNHGILKAGPLKIQEAKRHNKSYIAIHMWEDLDIDIEIPNEDGWIRIGNLPNPNAYYKVEANGIDHKIYHPGIILDAYMIASNEDKKKLLQEFNELYNDESGKELGEAELIAYGTKFNNIAKLREMLLDLHRSQNTEGTDLSQTNDVIIPMDLLDGLVNIVPNNPALDINRNKTNAVTVKEVTEGNPDLQFVIMDINMSVGNEYTYESIDGKTLEIFGIEDPIFGGETLDKPATKYRYHMLVKDQFGKVRTIALKPKQASTDTVKEFLNELKSLISERNEKDIDHNNKDSFKELALQLNDLMNNHIYIGVPTKNGYKTKVGLNPVINKTTGKIDGISLEVKIFNQDGIQVNSEDSNRFIRLGKVTGVNEFYTELRKNGLTEGNILVNISKSDPNIYDKLELITTANLFQPITMGFDFDTTANKEAIENKLSESAYTLLDSNEVIKRLVKSNITNISQIDKANIGLTENQVLELLSYNMSLILEDGTIDKGVYTLTRGTLSNRFNFKQYHDMRNAVGNIISEDDAMKELNNLIERNIVVHSNGIYYLVKPIEANEDSGADKINTEVSLYDIGEQYGDFTVLDVTPDGNIVYKPTILEGNNVIMTSTASEFEQMVSQNKVTYDAKKRLVYIDNGQTTHIIKLFGKAKLAEVLKNNDTGELSLIDAKDKAYRDGIDKFTSDQLYDYLKIPKPAKEKAKTFSKKSLTTKNKKVFDKINASIKHGSSEYANIANLLREYQSSNKLNEALNILAYQIFGYDYNANSLVYLANYFNIDFNDVNVKQDIDNSLDIVKTIFRDNDIQEDAVEVMKDLSRIFNNILSTSKSSIETNLLTSMFQFTHPEELFKFITRFEQMYNTNDMMTRKKVVEILDVTNIVNIRIKEYLVKSNLMSEDDAIGGLIQENPDPKYAFNAMNLFFAHDGTITFINHDAIIKFDKDGNVLESNIRVKNELNEVESFKSKIDDLIKMKEDLINFKNSERFKTKTVTDLFGNTRTIPKSKDELAKAIRNIDEEINSLQKEIDELAEKFELLDNVTQVDNVESVEITETFEPKQYDIDAINDYIGENYEALQEINPEIIKKFTAKNKIDEVSFMINYTNYFDTFDDTLLNNDLLKFIDEQMNGDNLKGMNVIRRYTELGISELRNKIKGCPE